MSYIYREELLDVLCKDHSFDIYRFQFHRLWFSPLFDPSKSCLFFYLVGVEDSTELLGYQSLVLSNATLHGCLLALAHILG
jgi:hypothetical protein